MEMPIAKMKATKLTALLGPVGLTISDVVMVAASMEAGSVTNLGTVLTVVMKSAVRILQNVQGQLTSNAKLENV